MQRITGGKGVQYVSPRPNAVNEAARMVNRGGRICLAAFPHEAVPVDLAYIVRNNIYLFGIRGELAAPPIARRLSWRRSGSRHAAAGVDQSFRIPNRFCAIRAAARWVALRPSPSMPNR